MLVQESVVRRHNKMADIGIVAQTADFFIQFLYGFLAGGENFIFGSSLISARVNLVVVNKHHIFCRRK